LVLGGAIVAASGRIEAPRLDPDLRLLLLLPPLLFDAAFRQDVHQAGRIAPGILIITIFGVAVTAAGAGAVLPLLLGMPIAVGLLFGSIVAPTDPVAVVPIFRRLHLPAALSSTAEIESLANDGMALALYAVFLDLALGRLVDPASIGILFAKSVLGGVGIGVGLGLLFSRMTALVDDHLVEMTLSTALAYGSYLLAQSLGMSGALACVTAGLVHGSYGRSVGMSSNTRRLLDDLWEYLGFAANAVVFLLLGLTVDASNLVEHVGPILAVLAAILLTRGIVVGTALVVLPHRRIGIGPAAGLLLVWGGLRGALTAAMALALPEELVGRETLVAVAFGTVLLSLLVQGPTLPLLIRRLRLARDAPSP
jgi:CPA1 family monovalent cation:H+ antiporter